jgi:MoaA/NifB/PqqE/SkfB family radical SAM enzyme
MPGDPTFWIDGLRGPLFVSWQLTRDCDLACVHCCTESAPGKRLADELNAEEALRVAEDLVSNEVPYVMLCGGEPLVVPHFLPLAERLGQAGVKLKIETNGQQLDGATLQRLARLPVRSIQISLDGDTQETYSAQRPGGSLAKAHEACRAVRDAGLPLEITFAPTRRNIHEAPAVIERAASLGAFRFNTGQLMRVGTAARLWKKLEPSPDQYVEFRSLLDRMRSVPREPSMELCYTPFSLQEGLRASAEEPPATLLILSNGWVKVAAALPFICADLRRHSLPDTWARYRNAWRDDGVRAASYEASRDEAPHAHANDWLLTTSI